MSNTNQEIDLGRVFKSIGKGFQVVINWCVNFVKYFLRHKTYFGAFILIGILYGIISFYLKPKEYYSKMTIKSHLLNNQYCLDMVEALGDLVDNSDYSEVSRLLNIDTTYTSEISEISFKTYEYNLNPDRDSVSENDPFSIQISVYDNRVLDTLQFALVQYLEKNPYAQKRREITEKNINDLSGKINDQIIQLDTLKSLIEGNLGSVNKTGGIMFLQQPIDPINTYREVVNLYERQLVLREKLLINSSVEVIQGFIKNSKPSKPKLLVNIAKNALLSLFLGLILSLFIFSKKNESKS